MLHNKSSSSSFPPLQLSLEQVEEVVSELGLQDAEGRGIEHEGLAGTLAAAVTGVYQRAQQ